MHLKGKEAIKAVEAILFVANRLPALTRHTLAKVFYFADKAHLQQYGRLMIRDEYYVAMKNGPVPSAVYDIVKDPEKYAKDALRAGTGYFVKPLRHSDARFLSESEIDCLAQSVKENGHKGFDELTRISHDSAWLKADEDDRMAIEDIAMTVPDSDAIIAHLSDPYSNGSWGE